MFIETNNIFELDSYLLPPEINLKILERAFIEYKKLDKYYHFKPNINTLQPNINNNHRYP